MGIGRTAPKSAIDIVIQWSNGKALARTEKNGRFVSFVGWSFEIGKNTDLDSALAEVACPQIEIKHQRPGGSQIVRHWSFGEEMFILPITTGPVSFSMRECLTRHNRPLMAEAGLGIRWTQGEKSKLALRCIAKPLWNAGIRKIVQVSVKSLMTDKLIEALLDHTRIATAADAFAKKGVIVSPADLWLPLGAGEEEEFGKGDTAPVIPMISLHPETPDADYFKSIWRANDQAELVLSEWSNTQEWAASFAEEPEVRESFDRGTGEVYDSPAA